MAKANIVCRVLFMTLNFTETHATENVPVIHCLRSCVLCLGGFSSITCLQCRLSCIRTTWVTSRLDSHHNLAVSLNVDWFQPYSRVTDSLRSYILEYIEFSSSRYKQENIILVGIIPGPKEPKFNINSYLSPLVDELKEFCMELI